MRLTAAARRSRSDAVLFSLRRLSCIRNSCSPNSKASHEALLSESSPSSGSKTTPNPNADGRHNLQRPFFSSSELPFIKWCERCGLFTSEIRRNLDHRQGSAILGPAIFSGLLKKYVIRKDAAEVLVEMVDSEVFPQKDFPLWKLISRMCHSGHVRKAWDFVHTLKIGGGLVDTSCCNALLTELKKIRDFEKMNMMISEMKDWVVPPDHITYSIVLDHLCKTNRNDKIRTHECSIQDF